MSILEKIDVLRGLHTRSITCVCLYEKGVTFRVEKDDLVIARILYGGMIDRQGLLHVGDIIKEVNGQEVGSNPTQLQEMLKDCSGGITLKILPSYIDSATPPQVWLAHGHTDTAARCQWGHSVVAGGIRVLCQNP